jgi:hypothetical protein
MAEYHYIARQDYRRIIEQHEVLTIVDSDPLVLADAETVALEEIKMYLNSRYDIADYFRPIYTWNAQDLFTIGQRVEVTSEPYDEDSTYEKGDMVSTLVFVYRANRAILAGQGPKECPLFWDEVGQPNTIYEALTDNTDVAPSDNPEDWKVDDSRNPFFVTLMTDIVLYHLMSRAGQLPDIRVKRYNDAISRLKAIAAGKIDLGLPLLETAARATNRAAMRSNPKPLNNW